MTGIKWAQGSAGAGQSGTIVNGDLDASFDVTISLNISTSNAIIVDLYNSNGERATNEPDDILITDTDSDGYFDKVGFFFSGSIVGTYSYTFLTNGGEDVGASNWENVGATSARISGNVSIGGDVTISKILSVSGQSNFSSDVFLGNDLSVAKTLTVSGQLYGEQHSFQMASPSTLSTGLTIGGVLKNVTGKDLTIQDITATVGTAPTGSSIQIDVNVDSVSILSTLVEVDDGQDEDDGNYVLSSTSIPKNAKVTFDIDQVGSTTAGEDLWITVRTR